MKDELMKTGYLKKLTLYMTFALISVLPALLIPSTSASALSISEYFSIVFDPPALSQNQITGNQEFSVTIHAKATCIKNLPVSVSEAVLSSRIEARNTTSNTVVILHPTYTLALNPFPDKQGNSTEISKTVPLQFDAQTPSGTYTVTAELLEAKIKSMLIWIDVTEYFPPSQSVGSVVYTAPQAIAGPGGGGGSGGGGSAGAGGTQTKPNLFTGVQPSVNVLGYTSGASQLETPDGKLKLDINGGTRLLNEKLSALNTLTVTPADSVPQAPASNSIVSAYELGPSGATFDPYITLTFSYSDSSLSAGVAESSLYIAWWNGSQWEKLDTIIDTNTNTVSARISHFSSFALLAPVSTTVSAPQTTPIPLLTPTVSTPVAPSAITGMPPPQSQTVPIVQPKITPKPSVTATPAESQPVSQPVTTTPPSSTPTSYWFIIVVIISIIVFMLIIFLIFQKRY